MISSCFIFDKLLLVGVYVFILLPFINFTKMFPYLSWRLMFQCLSYLKTPIPILPTEKISFYLKFSRKNVFQIPLFFKLISPLGVMTPFSPKWSAVFSEI